MSTEILQIADAVAREKGLGREQIILALEEAIRVAARRKYGQEQAVLAEINRKTGDISLYRELFVVEHQGEEIPEEIAEEHRGIDKLSLQFALLKHPNAKLGDIVLEPLPPLDLGRVVAQAAKQVIVGKVREAERDKQREEFRGRIGEIVSGVVEKVEHGDVIVKLGSADAILRRRDVIRTDNFANGHRMRACLMEINPESRGPQIILSRTHPQFLAKLFAQEVPEIYSNIIEIKAVARDPGLRAKIAVYSSDASIDAVGSCVGIRGSRVQAVITELGGEKIDIIPWSSDPATLVVNAIAPAEALKVIIDEYRRRIEVVVPDDQLSIAIGRGGQNVRLASELVGWQLDITTESEESKRRVEEFNTVTQKFMSALDLEEILAQLLASEGYVSINDIANSNINEIMQIEGLDEAVANELISRARAYLEAHPEEVRIINKDTGVEEEEESATISDMQQVGVNRALMVKLSAQGINSLRDLADLSYDEFVELVPDSGLSSSRVEKLIMSARQVVYFNKPETHNTKNND